MIINLKEEYTATNDFKEDQKIKVQLSNLHGDIILDRKDVEDLYIFLSQKVMDKLLKKQM